MPGSTRIGEMKSSRSDSKKSKELEKMRRAEEEFQRMLDSGKVKNLDKARNKIVKKYGVWPNGMTN
jgi:hypothetical protein